jgi:hypothetical protein
MRRTVLGLAVLLGLSARCLAGVYTDELSTCFVDSTSPDDKTALVRWVFVAASAHPAVAPVAKVTAADRDASNKAMGEMVTRLLTGPCKDKAKLAIKYESSAAIQLSFQVLGQAAVGELFSNPAVSGAMDGVGKYIDPTKIEALRN